MVFVGAAVVVEFVGAAVVVGIGGGGSMYLFLYLATIQKTPIAKKSRAVSNSCRKNLVCRSKS